MPPARALDLFDTALATDGPVLAPLLIAPPRIGEAPGRVPPLLREPRRPARPTAHFPADGSHGHGYGHGYGYGHGHGDDHGSDATPAMAWRHRLRALPDDAGRKSALLELVRAEIAEVLAHPDGSAVAPDRLFLERGSGSLTGVLLRNRLSACTGPALSVTVIFDRPSAREPAGHPHEELRRDGAFPPPLS
ncbi:beta-ketoacyl reductase [Streptomyces abikoensis]|uniref:acyl carrier protein n=1 Tax=Streptomyces abikoensis TaxID=97398 RepID=UPI00340DF5A9